ncbi:Protein FAM117B [Lemmus lemmus]
MAQRVRRNGSPTPAGALAGGAVGPAGGPGSRLQPMRATVPFQLKQQQQHGSPTRGGGGGGGGGNNGGGASGPSGGGGAPRTASRSTSPTRGGGGSAAARTSPTVATQTGASPTSTRGTSPTRGTAPAARSSPPRPQPPPPLLGTVSSPSSSPTHLWPGGEVSAAPPPVRVRHRRRSPEQGRPSAEKRSPSAPVCKAGDKTRPPSSSPSSIIRRTSSLDTLAAPYLAGHWPRDSRGQAAPCMRDKATQTESAWAEEYAEKKKGSHKRSASWGSTEQLKEIAKLRQQLQRSKHSSRHHRDKERQSPFHGNHAAINQSQAPAPKSTLIPAVPITKSTGSRFRNSVEGLNQEIEIIIKETGEKEEQLVVKTAGCGGSPVVPVTRSSAGLYN